MITESTNTQIKELKKKDYKKAIQFAIVGMHFNWYIQNDWLLNLYGKYFWYNELNQATQVFALYLDEKLAGVLLIDMIGETKKYKTFGKTLYVYIFDFLQKLFYKDGVDKYNDVNKILYNKYQQDNNPDGQIIFLAADPTVKVKGIGSRLLKELECQEKGKQIYLYTDSACNYQFYEKRGFKRVGQKEVILTFDKRKVLLKCFLYSKRLL